MAADIDGKPVQNVTMNILYIFSYFLDDKY